MAFQDILDQFDSMTEGAAPMRKPLVKRVPSAPIDPSLLQDTATNAAQGAEQGLVNNDYDPATAVRHQSERKAESDPDPDKTLSKYATHGDGKIKPRTESQDAAMEDAMAVGANHREIQKLLSDFDQVNKDARQRDAFNGFTEAGMEFGHAMGGEAVDQKFMDRAHARARQPVEDFKASNKMKMDNEDQQNQNQKADTDRKIGNNSIIEGHQKINNEDDLMNKSSEASALARQLAEKEGYKVSPDTTARDILDNIPLVKEDQEQIKATRHENESNKRTQSIIFGQNKRNVEDNATKLTSDMLKSADKESINGMRGMDLQNKISQRAIHGFKFIDMDKGFLPGEVSSSRARQLSGDYFGMEPIMRNMISTIQANPRNFWGTDAWNKLKSQYGSLSQSKNKLNENGVMNGKDWDNIAQEIGDPDTANQWVAQGGLARLIQSYKDSQTKFIAKMNQDGYEPGDMNLNNVPAYSGAGGGAAGKSGNTLKPDQSSFDTVYGQTGIPGAPPKFGGNKGTPTAAVPTAEGLDAKLKLLKQRRGNK